MPVAGLQIVDKYTKSFQTRTTPFRNSNYLFVWCPFLSMMLQDRIKLIAQASLETRTLMVTSLETGDRRFLVPKILLGEFGDSQ